MGQETVLWKHSLHLTKYVKIYSLYEPNESKR